METIFAGTSGESLSSDAYRQVSYVNDVNRANVQAVMEYTVNGEMGESITSYSFGMQRESYTMTLPGLAAGNGETSFRVEGTYYYTGTGSVSNLTGPGGSGRSYAYALGGEAHTFAMYQGETDVFSITAGTCSAYAYNGEYTHQSIGLQYLRARYLNMETGIFISRDSYAGKVWDILSQNRYTYAENNPVNYGDPSGHAKAVKGVGSAIGSKVTGGLSNLKTSLVPNVTKRSTNVPLSVGATHGVGITTRNVPLSVGATHGTGLVSTPNKLPSLLDNIRTYNGKEYYNDLIVRVPVRALMSTVGGMTYAESVAAQIEAKRCATYGYCENDVQEKISLSVGVTYFDVFLSKTDELVEDIKYDFKYNWLKEDLPSTPFVTSEFLDKVVKISNELGLDPDDLMAVMAFESWFNPSEKNKAGSTAMGLIQFMEETAISLGTSTEELANMTALEQLEYVYEYYKPYTGKIENLGDTYMVVLYPRAIGKEDNYGVFKMGTRSYEQNKELDINRDGIVTKKEATEAVIERRNCYEETE